MTGGLMRLLRLVAVVALVGVALAALSGPPNTLITTTLRTEVLEVRVGNPHAMRMTLREARRLGETACLRDVVVEPARGAVVRYAREMRRELVVGVRGSAEWEAAGGARGGGPVAFVVGPGCGAGSAMRLPVAGVARFGETGFFQDPAVPPLALLEGRLSVFGRALPEVLGMSLEGTPLVPHALYLASEVPLPGGSVLGDDPAAAGPADAAVWFGHVAADLTTEGAPGVAVDASTNARDVRLFLPIPNLGEGRASGAAETISLTTLARLVGDPNLLIVYFVLGLVAAAVSIVNSGRELWSRKEET